MDKSKSGIERLRNNNYLRTVDYYLIVPVFLLTVIGLYVLSKVLSSGYVDYPNNLYRQIMASGLGLTIALIICLLDTHFMKLVGWCIYGASIFLLLLVPIDGFSMEATWGADSWLSIPVIGTFGISIKKAYIDKFIELTDEALKDMQSEPLYYVDYIFRGVDVKPETILDIANLNDIWGQDMDESFICIENLKVVKENLTLMSPDKRPTLKITLPNKICLIKFGSSQEEYEKLLTDGYIELNIVGKCNMNE